MRSSYRNVAIYLIIGLLAGAVIGYLVETQVSSGKIKDLQNQIDSISTEIPRGNIVQKGSDTLLIVAQRWAEEYMNKHSAVSISVAGGGSGVGFSALAQKTTDIADASREIKSSEIQTAKSNGVNPVEWVVGLDGIAIVVNKGNPITEMTMEQLEKIYNGTYTNWKQVGGNDATIITYGRQSTSGTYDFFREHVLHNKNFRADNRELAGNAEIVNSVMGDVNGIGYVGVAYTKKGVNVKIVRIKSAADATAYEPSVENIKSGTYPIARKLYIYTNGVPTGTLADYVAFILGPEGQQILEEVGYISYIKVDK
ncbi:PstS family phosphate ABC transporter substrate-binding protein [Candidatus Bathyarchaeota archaeon]|nr:PstS family phosphate ABC transporter substrate-binding protein [Candidatus Bathyarchaeota archaeon]